MPKVVKPLRALEVTNLKGEGMHAVGTVSGLHLNISKAETKSWVLRKKFAGKRHEIGLGSYPEVGLALAIARAREITDDIYNGIDPIAKRKQARVTTQWTFKRCAEEYIESFAPKWTNAKTRPAWENTLATYVYPVFGHKPVENVTLDDVLTVLKPEWVYKHVTMSRVRQRIEAVLGWAGAKGYRSKENPATLKNNLVHLLPENVHKPLKQPAMEIDAVPLFVKMLSEKQSVGNQCLLFLLLTACRSENARGARWSEIDLEKKEWYVEWQFMKLKKPHRTPLSDAAIELLKALPKFDGTDLIFPSIGNQMLSNGTMGMVIKRMNKPVVLFKDPDDGRATVPHGLRSTFVTWAQECTQYTPELREHALAHTVGGSVTQSYERGDMFEKRRALMQDWAEFCELPQTQASNVTNITDRLTAA